MIAHNKPCMDEKDAAAAYETVLSGWLAYGEKSVSLEKKITRFICQTEGNNAVVCSSGTTALYLALHALDIKCDDEVILPTYTCTAVLNAVMQIGAEPILADVDEKDIGLSLDAVKAKITKRTKAIIVIHTYGITCEVDSLKELGVPIIEDCSQSLGSKFQDGSMTGSKGDVSVFSFYATKLITGGYGGAVLSKHKTYVERVRDYINFDQPESFYPRFNFLLSDINASIISSQFEKLDDFLKRRRLIAQKYRSAAKSQLLKYADLENQNYYRFLLYFKTEEELLQAFNKFKYNNISVINPLTNSELLHVYIEDKKNSFKVADALSYRLLSLPIYPCLQDDEIENIIETLKGL